MSREKFEKFFKKKFKDLHEAVCCGDLVASNYKKAIYKTWKEQQKLIDELESQVLGLKKFHQIRDIAENKTENCCHFSTTMFHDGKAECFHCNAIVNEKREIVGQQSKGLFNKESEP